MNGRTAKLINRVATVIASRTVSGRPVSAPQSQYIRSRVRDRLIQEWHNTPRNKRAKLRKRLEQQRWQ